MPVWTVQITGDEAETVAAELLATEYGSLIALSAEGVLLRAWAPGQWRSVRHVGDDHPGPIGRTHGDDRVLIGLPHG
jgi:hypothetical protein